jgi:hypothetical protein
MTCESVGNVVGRAEVGQKDRGKQLEKKGIASPIPGAIMFTD